MSTTHLYLIRHGEAVSNVDHTLGGIKSDAGLTERGMLQARALGERLASEKFTADVLYASDLPRAKTTAEFVSEAIGLPISFDEELQELRPGDADGLHVEEARSRYESMSRFLIEVYTPIAPNGESWGSFQARVSAALERIVVRHMGQKIVVVCHGGVIEVSFLHLLGLGPDARRRAAFHVRNTAITHWRFVETPTGRQEWHLAGHNDYRHLLGLAGEGDDGLPV